MITRNLRSSTYFELLSRPLVQLLIPNNQYAIFRGIEAVLRVLKDCEDEIYPPQVPTIARRMS
jgi:hypothetical protein